MVRGRNELGRFGVLVGVGVQDPWTQPETANLKAANPPPPPRVMHQPCPFPLRPRGGREKINPRPHHSHLAGLPGHFSSQILAGQIEVRSVRG